MSLNEKNLDRLITEALAIEAEEAREAGALGFMARGLTLATMPHRRVDANEFKRANGNFTLTMLAPSDIGLPYGSIPRLLMVWLTTEAVKTKERELVLGDSMSKFMHQLGLVPTGGRWGSITRLKDQTTRLFGCTVYVYSNERDKPGGLSKIDIGKTYLWWEAKDPKQKTLWESTVTLSEEFYKEAISHPVPVDIRALKALKQSPMAVDTYVWLTYRMSYLRHKTEIPWEVLQAQFGADYNTDKQGVRNFKRKFLNHLRKVHVVYPEAEVAEGDHGLVLRPSKPHIARLKQ